MRTAIAALLILAMTSGWAAAQNSSSSAAQASLAPRTASSQSTALIKNPVSSDYVIGPGDVLKISVWQEPQFDETVEVRPDGRISLPLVSDIVVSGFTPDGVQNRVTDRLQGFVKHPRVSVVVAEVRSKMVYVIGQVEHPGAYPMTGAVNVGQLIARAGGVTRRAKTKHVYVLRAGISKKFPVNYKKVLQGKDLRQNGQLAPGDTVVVP